MRNLMIACGALTAIAATGAIAQGAKPKSLAEQVYALPESTLKTQCSAGAAYPGHKVQPSFYAYPEPPEFERYTRCVLAEAKRDGGKKRVASAASFPRVGTCYASHVTSIGSRFADGKPDKDTGTSIGFANRLNLVDYAYVAPVARSRRGDPVRACVASLPKGCPATDLRGIFYRVTNLRTRESWAMSDSQHMCRGA